MSQLLPNGIGESLGDLLVTQSPLLASGTIWYVHHSAGVDDVGSGYGIAKTRPFASLDYTEGQASAGDTIVLLDGHTETGVSVEIDKPLVIVGVGEADGEPTVTFQGVTGSYVIGFTALALGSELRGVKFLEHPSASSIPHVSIAGNFCRFEGCVFEAGENNNGSCLDLGTNFGSYVESCVFRSVSTDAADPPDNGLIIEAGRLFMRNTVFDGGTNGWSSNAAFKNFDAATIRAIACSLINGADALIDVDSLVHWTYPGSDANSRFRII
jgi:hypothetical protein